MARRGTGRGRPVKVTVSPVDAFLQESRRLAGTGEDERRFQGRVIKLARALGWRCHHETDSRFSRPGFPDLILIKDGRMVVAELKVEGGKLEDEQAEWLAAFSAVPGVQTHVWWDWQFEEVVRCLS